MAFSWIQKGVAMQKKPQMQLQSQRDQEQAPTPDGPSQEMWTPVACQPVPFASTSLLQPLSWRL